MIRVPPARGAPNSEQPRNGVTQGRHGACDRDLPVPAAMTLQVPSRFCHGLSLRTRTDSRADSDLRVTVPVAAASAGLAAAAMPVIPPETRRYHPGPGRPVRRRRERVVP